MKALIAGATGLIGSYLLSMLLEDPYYEQVVILTRRTLDLSDEKSNKIVTDFDKIRDVLTGIQVDHVFCCLGTTIKKAGSKEAFKKVDFEYPMELARITLKNKADKFLLVTALGANKHSIIFYNRVKGEVEEAIRQLGFPSLYIFRPSLLLGIRDEKRMGEDIAKKTYKYLDKIFIGPFKKYKGIHAKAVAVSMLRMAKSSQTGTVILESDKIKEA